jgi:signal transduction histidine kinase
MVSENTLTPDGLIQGVLLDVLSSETGLPCAIVNWRGAEEIRWSCEGTGRIDAGYCAAIRTVESGCARCVRDQCESIQDLEGPILTLCRAGLHNYVVPIRTKGEVREALVLGQMRLRGNEFEGRSVLNHETLLQRLAMDGDSKRRIRDLFKDIPTLNADELGKALERARSIAQCYSVLRNKELDLEVAVERVAHELQIRLQAVLARAENLFCDLQNTPAVTEDTRTAVKGLLDSIAALNVVIHNFGEFAGEYQFRVCRIGEIVYDSEQLYEAEARHKSVSIRVDLEAVDGNPPVLEVSERHMQLAVHNLVQNAVKYSYRGARDRHRLVEITGRPYGDYYCIEITNYGVGILEHELDKIFEQGYRGELAEGEYRTGSGRGLYFVKRVVEAHKGRISVISRQENSGWLTTFRVCLPFRQARRQEPCRRG